MKATKISLLYILAILLVFSCKKGDDPQPQPQPTKKDWLTQSWRMVKVIANGSEQPVSGYTLRFTSGNTYTATGPMLSVTGSGTWSFNPSETALLLNAGPEQFRIVTLSAERMVLEVDQKTYKAGDLLVRFEFEK